MSWKRTSERLVTRLQDVATIYNNPRYIFDECLTFLGQQRIALPAYITPHCCPDLLKD